MNPAPETVSGHSVPPLPLEKEAHKENIVFIPLPEKKPLSPVTRFENFHIFLWLIKDISWLMEWKYLGIFMIFPTVSVAAYITLKTSGARIFWINLAVCFWISANVFWMLCEFFERVDLKNYAAYPFIAGLLCTAWFFLSQRDGHPKKPGKQ